MRKHVSNINAEKINNLKRAIDKLTQNYEFLKAKYIPYPSKIYSSHYSNPSL